MAFIQRGKWNLYLLKKCSVAVKNKKTAFSLFEFAYAFLKFIRRGSLLLSEILNGNLRKI